MLPFIVKVCGVTTRQDAQAAVDAGANALGFNFYTRSPRYLAMERALEVMSGLRGEFLRVAVFVDPSNEILAAAAGRFDVAQVHGALPEERPLSIWRAIPAAKEYRFEQTADAWLLDTFTPAFGGSGRTFDWSLAKGFPQRAILAGGLDGDNVSDAIRTARPWGVDSCSRLESTPGRKDQRKVAAFVNAALHAFHDQQVVNI